MSEIGERRSSRRGLLAALAGTAGAFAAQTLTKPLSVAGASGEPVVIGTTNTGGAPTVLVANVAGAALTTHNAVTSGVAAGAVAANDGTAIHAVAGGPGAPRDETYGTGVYGYASATEGILAVGVWGDSDDVGVLATGYEAIIAEGYASGVVARAQQGTAVDAVGEGASTGVKGGSQTGVGVHALSKAGVALRVDGKVQFGNRSGKIAGAAGATSVSKTITGVTTSSIVIAVLQKVETGTWVRAAVGSANKITVYFNRALPTSAYVGYLVIN